MQCDNAKPIQINVEMTKAKLEGRKTMFRVEVAGGFLDDAEAKLIQKLYAENKYDEAEKVWGFEPDIKVGDVLYIQEEFIRGYEDYYEQNNIKTFYKADDNLHSWIDGTDEEEIDVPWNPASEMPKEYARIFSKITNIRIEKFWQRTYEEIVAEGCPEDILCMDDNPYQDEWFENQYPKINPQDYVLVYEFERVEG